MAEYIPNKSLTVGDETLLMSYGMFSEIMRIIGDPDNAVETLMSDSNTRDWVIRRLFTKTNKPVETAEDLMNPYDIPLDPTEMDQVIAWVADHVLHFTISTAGKVKPVVERYITSNEKPAS
jgi:hypothetical protein